MGDLRAADEPGGQEVGRDQQHGHRPRGSWPARSRGTSRPPRRSGGRPRPRARSEAPEPSDAVDDAVLPVFVLVAVAQEDRGPGWSGHGEPIVARKDGAAQKPAPRAIATRDCVAATLACAAATLAACNCNAASRAANAARQPADAPGADAPQNGVMRRKRGVARRKRGCVANNAVALPANAASLPANPRRSRVRKSGVRPATPRGIRQHGAASCRGLRCAVPRRARERPNAARLSNAARALL